MWVFGKTGFLSIVKHRYLPGRLMIRARVREDLESFVSLLDEISGGHHKIKKTSDADYGFRTTARKEVVAQAIARLTAEIDYTNFKDEIHKQADPDRDRAYMDVWAAMHGLQNAKLRKPGLRSSDWYWLGEEPEETN